MSCIPYLGSKISLVSKSEIRYEGILYTIDPKDSTIALAKVRSFGTEDRKTDKPVAARDEVYEYIIFRASDIKDLVVEDPPTSTTALTDPAIIQAHSMTGGSNFENSAFSTTGTVNTRGIQSTTNAMQSGASSDQRSNTYSSVFNASASGAVSASSNDNPAGGVFSSSHDFRSGGSTPTTGHRRSPLSESGNQIQRSDSRDKPYGNQTGRENRDSRNFGGQRGRGVGGDRNFPQHYQYRRSNFVPQRQTQQGNYRGNRQGPPPPRRAPTMSRPHQSYNRGPVNHKGKAESGIKIDGDYDFEKANQEFQELENKLQKVKIDTEKDKDETTTTTTTTNAITTENEKKENEEENDTCYDKSKSFFDKISCEALERSKGKLNRIDWKQERKLNAETFGYSNNYRRGGGNYGRGRGGFGFRQYRNDGYSGNRQSFGNAGGGGDTRRMNGPRGNRFHGDMTQW